MLFRSSALSSSYDGGGLLAMDFDSVALAFITCAGLSSHKRTSSPSSMQWLINPSYIEQSSSSTFDFISADERDLGSGGPVFQDSAPALLYIVENLICVLHNMNAAATQQERACWTLDLDRCVGVAERDFPSHSFVKQVGIWIRDKINHDTV